MKNYDEDEEASYIQDLDANNLYGWTLSQKFPVKDFKWVTNVFKINEDFIKNYDEDGNIGYFLNVDTEYPRELYDLHSDFNKCSKLVCNLHDKENYKSFKTSTKAWSKTKKSP